MLFLAGIANMEIEEKRQLLAQLQSFDSLLVIKEGAMESVKKAKNWFADKSAKLAGKAGKEDWQEQIRELDRKSDWDVTGLKDTMEKELELTKNLTDYEVRAYLKEDIARLVSMPRSSSMEEISQATCAHIARQCKVPQWEALNPGELEQKLYQLCLEEQIEMIKQRLSKLNQDEGQETEEILQKEIESLSQSEQESMRHAIGVDELTGTAVLTLFKNSSAVLIAQILIAGSGFGAYLFLSTMIKAISLLQGMTLSFGVYTRDSAVLAFVLSPLFLLLVVSSGGGILWWQTRGKLNDYLIKAVFMAGKAKLASDEMNI